MQFISNNLKNNNLSSNNHLSSLKNQNTSSNNSFSPDKTIKSASHINYNSVSINNNIESEYSSSTFTAPQECAGCQKSITDRYMLQTMDQYWHEDCLKCSCCDCRLGEVGSTLYTKANLLLCRRDYLRLFGATGNCSVCMKVIPAFEMVMKARDHVYHLECFACQQCNHRFCIGDRYYLWDSQILCEIDYEDKLMLSRINNNSGNNNNNNTNNNNNFNNIKFNNIVTSSSTATKTKHKVQSQTVLANNINSNINNNSINNNNNNNNSNNNNNNVPRAKNETATC